jgi:NitT/TauT family transport system ATP-binding protein
VARVKQLNIKINRKKYSGDFVALEHLNLTAAAGEFLAIVGPSGSGKTTLLNIVSGLDPDVDGELRIDGSIMHADETPPEHIGFIFQEPRLMPWLTVLNNVALVLADDADSLESARRLLREVGLSGFENHYPGQLSGGMQRRVALARGFAMRPSLLLMDEPFLSLDAPTADRLRGQLLTLWEELRPTILFVTHDLREALSLADRLVFLTGSPGRVVLELPVTLTRPRDREGREIGALHDRLLRDHPDLLSGLADAKNKFTPGSHAPRGRAEGRARDQ